jgi:hypothetical protein
MNKIILWLGLVAVAVLTGCTTKPYVETDYQSDYNFAGLHTFSLVETQQDTKENLLVSPFTLSHIHAALETELQQRYQKAASGAGDFEVRYHVVLEEKIDPRSYDDLYGFGFYDPRFRRYQSPFFHGTTTGLRLYDQGSLIIDMVDGKTKKPIWRGVSAKRLNRGMSPQQQREVLSRAVVEVISQFPPVD